MSWKHGLSSIQVRARWKGAEFVRFVVNVCGRLKQNVESIVGNLRVEVYGPMLLSVEWSRCGFTARCPPRYSSAHTSVHSVSSGANPSAL